MATSPPVRPSKKPAPPPKPVATDLVARSDHGPNRVSAGPTSPPSAPFSHKNTPPWLVVRPSRPPFIPLPPNRAAHHTPSPKNDLFLNKSPLSPNKPALLPKPQLINKTFHPDVVLSTEKTVKAPVAKLYEFEPNKRPVRPPRSPKNINFPNGPFGETSLGKPILPVKKKTLVFDKPACESVTPSLSEVKKGKSASLGRNVEPPNSEWNISSGSKSVPIRPPRRRKCDSESGRLVLGHPLCRSISLFSSIEEAEKNIPIYAVVNYNLKKNRRQTTQTSSTADDFDSKNLHFCFDVNTSVENLITQSAQDVCHNRLSLTSDVSSQTGDFLTACCVNSDKETPDKKDNVMMGNSHNEPLKLEVKQSEPITEEIAPIAPLIVDKLSEKWSSAEAIEDSYASSKYVSAKASLQSSLGDLVVSEVFDENKPNDSFLFCNKSSEHVSEIVQVNHEIIHETIQVVDLNNISKPNESFLFVSISTPGQHVLDVSFEDTNSNGSNTMSASSELINSKIKGNSDPDVTKENRHSYAEQSLNKEEFCSESQLASASLEVDNKLKERANSVPRMSGTTKDSINQGDWSKDDWCDEGELSTGVLADVDSSDAARQSSFDDIAGSDMDDSTPVRRKLRSLTNFTKNMLRKSGRKSKESKKDSLHSHFYCSNSSDNVHVETASKLTEESEGSHVEVSETRTEPQSESDNEEEFFRPSTLSLDLTLTEQQKQDKKAFQIAEEIMVSERVFVDVLKLLSVDFRSFVEAASRDHKHPVIPESDLCKILNHLPQILSLNEDLLHDLEQRILSWSNVGKISDVIAKKGPFLKLYASYIQDFSNQCSFLDECCQKHHTFGKVVQDFEATPRCKKLSLKHYMLKPVQRIPQYRLLLENYVRCLEPGSPDFDDTQLALQIVCDVANHANHTMKQGDAISKLLKLQSLLSHYELLKPGRVLRREGELLKVCRKGMQPRYFILLNDCLLYTTYYGSSLSSGLKVNYEIPLQQMKVSISSAPDYGNEFSIISMTRSFTLVASSSDEMQQWVDDLQAAIHEKTNKESTFLQARSAQNEVCSSKLGKEAPVWIPDRRVTMCQICTTEFTVTFRRHHCRACGKVVCGDCSANKAPLQYLKFQVARVCNDCFNVLSKEFKDSSLSLPSNLSSQQANDILESAKLHFNKSLPAAVRKSKRYIPQRLKEVCANDAGCQISGSLQRLKENGKWKRMWFVLKDQVLYVYKASEDIVALDSIPVLGYQLNFAQDQSQLYEGIDAKLVFMLTHKGQPQLVFHADNYNSSQRWIKALQEATTLQ